MAFLHNCVLYSLCVTVFLALLLRGRGSDCQGFTSGASGFGLCTGELSLRGYYKYYASGEARENDYLEAFLLRTSGAGKPKNPLLTPRSMETIRTNTNTGLLLRSTI